jgi:hypothetical protein
MFYQSCTWNLSKKKHTKTAFDACYGSQYPQKDRSIIWYGKICEVIRAENRTKSKEPVLQTWQLWHGNVSPGVGISLQTATVARQHLVSRGKSEVSRFHAVYLCPCLTQYLIRNVIWNTTPYFPQLLVNNDVSKMLRRAVGICLFFSVICTPEWILRPRLFRLYRPVRAHNSSNDECLPIEVWILFRYVLSVCGRQATRPTLGFRKEVTRIYRTSRLELPFGILEVTASILAPLPSDG